MRPDRYHQEESSQDSFLDVVANVVGVLIILVMLVGMQASQSLFRADNEASQDSISQAVATPVDLDALQAELESVARQTKLEQESVAKLAVRVAHVRGEADSLDQQRVELAMHRGVIEEDLARRRELLDSGSQREFDVQRELLQSQIELDRLTQEKISLASAAPVVEEIECVPTPLAKVMDIPSIHLRLRGGLVSIVPVERLREEFEIHSEEVRRRLQSSSRVVETFGPVDGYRAKFTFIRRAALSSSRGHIAGQVRENTLETYIEFLPTGDEIGQNVEQALMPGSALYEYLQSQRKQSPPIDVWLYTDSFNEFRPLKRALWEMGFTVATRALELHQTIGASPYGTKSAAQ